MDFQEVTRLRRGATGVRKVPAPAANSPTVGRFLWHK